MPMRKYEPNDRDREIVLRMAAIPNISLATIAFLIVNARTNKPISENTLTKVFKKELQIAKGAMQSHVMKSFWELISEKNWPAIKTALAAYCGIKEEAIAAVTNVNNDIRVRFIRSPYVDEPVPGVDGYDLDLEAARPPPVPLPGYQFEAPAALEPPRTEFDLPENKDLLVPWHRRPLRKNPNGAGKK